MARSAPVMNVDGLGGAADLDLPKSPEALKKIAQASLWTIELEMVNAQSRRRAWVVAGVASALAVMGFGAALAQFMQPPPAPKVLMVDKTTGESVVLPNLDERTVPQVIALDLHNAARYVRARETYNYSMLNADYNQVARMSTGEIFAPYQRLYVGPEALHEKLQDKELRRVTVIGVRPSGETYPGKSGEALVTYEREVRSQGIPAPVVTRFVATVRYEYRPAAVKKHADRLENPFGFVVTAYRTDAEVAPSRIEVTTANAQGGS